MAHCPDYVKVHRLFSSLLLLIILSLIMILLLVGDRKRHWLLVLKYFMHWIIAEIHKTKAKGLLYFLLWSIYYVQVADYNMQPETSLLSEQIRACLQETEEVPRDITSLFDSSLFKLDTTLVPKVLKLVFQFPNNKVY